MERKYQVISSDGHVETPPDVWVKYVPEKWQERAPRLIKLPEGGEGWVIEGMAMLNNGQNITAGKPVRFRGGTYFNDDGSRAPGAGDAAQRLREQDQDGIDCEVLFPPVFASRFLEGIQDREVYLSMIQAYNTFLAQDYCSVAPDRLIAAGVMPVTGIDDAIAELKRCKEIGLRTVTFYVFPNGSGGPKPEDDRFWQTAMDIEMRLSPHANFGDREPNFGGASKGTGGAGVASAMAQRVGGVVPTFCLSQLIYSGLFDRLPELRIYFAETNASWMPHAFWMFDDNYRVYNSWFKHDLKMMPSEYIKKHIMFGIIRDPMALRLREFFPAENLMWGSDHPHSVASFPRSREALAEIFDGVPDQLKRKILLENPAEFFGLDLDKPITPTPGVAVAVGGG
ncbi:MAG: amidohydrolase family protein [Chloroflexi bacterium]|nr:amidohydrolase family protein [Chloroflexota bacterium]